MSPVQVGVAHFAAMCGMSEDDFYSSFIGTMEKDSINNVLRPEAVKDVLAWVEYQELHGRGMRFGIMFRLSMNRPVDTALHCICTLQDRKTIKLIKSIPGMVGTTPKEMANQESFEMTFCDINMSLPHPGNRGIIDLLREAGNDVENQ